ncbi:MAG: response regulator transcription factor [Flavobacteriales bacterium]|nr:MAG: response regulator transcription factor [Flavobacteriales bacterium]
MSKKPATTALRAVIVDDEPHAIELLSGLLRAKHPEVEVVGIATNVQQGVHALRAFLPDVVFMDIELSRSQDGLGTDEDETCWRLLEQVSDVLPQIIFTTGHGSYAYALRALGFSNLGFIEKPVDAPRLAAALKRMGKETQQAEVELQALRTNSKHNRQIALPVTQREHGRNVRGFVFLDRTDIMYCTKNTDDDHYMDVWAVGWTRPILVRGALDDLEALLDRTATVVRVHEKALLNVQYVQQYSENDGASESGDGGVVEMKGGKRLPVSRRRKRALLDAFDLL